MGPSTTEASPPVSNTAALEPTPRDVRKKTRVCVRFLPDLVVLRLLPFDVPVDHRAGVALLLEEAGDLVGHHDRAVLAAGAADGDGEVVAALLDVARQQELQQVPDAGEEPLGRLL